MGVYTTTANSLDLDSMINESEFQYTPDYAGAVAIVAESESNYNAIMKAIGVAELQHFEESGTEIVYEAGTGLWTKFKEFFVKLWEKVKAMFKKFFAMLDSFVKSDKDFVNKYKGEIIKGSTKDLKVSGYKFSNLDWTPVEAGGTTAQKFTDDREENTDKIRGYVLTRKDGESISSADFHKESFEYFRSGESGKEELESINPTEQMNLILSYAETKKHADKAFTAFEKSIKASISEVEKMSKGELKNVPNSSESGDKVRAGAETVNTLRTIQNVNTMVNGAFLTALKDRNRQAKAICVALVGRKAPKNEGAISHYTEGSANFLDDVVLK